MKRNNHSCKINYVYTTKTWKNLDFDLKVLTKSMANLTLDSIGVYTFIDKPEFTINLSDDAELQSLNLEFMSKDYPTNVLSFPSNDAPKVGDYYGFESYIGDIAISFSRIEEESAVQGKSFKNHYAHMVVHAILHLMGYDHEREEEAVIMESKETELLNKLGIANPYEI